MRPGFFYPDLAHVVFCITQQHDYRLVGLAALVCVLSSLTTFALLSRAVISKGNVGVLWAVGAAAAFGAGVWTTHFVAMLSFNPGVPTAYEPGRTALSLFAAVALSVPGFLVFQQFRSQPGRWIAALVVAAAIAVMHYTGMSAMLMSGVFWHDGGYVVLSIVVGAGFSIASFASFSRGRVVLAGALLVPAICGLHFLGIAAVVVAPVAGPNPIEGGLPANYLALAVAAMGFMGLLLALFTAVADRRLTARTEQEVERLKRFADATSEGILFLRDDRIVDANSSMCLMAGRSSGELVGQTVGALFGAAAFRWMAAGATGLFETDLANSSGNDRPVELLRRELIAIDGANTVLAVHDLSARKQAEYKISQLANYDALTGLANRRLFRDQLDKALALAARSGASTALLCLDLDGFKLVNDKLGHPAGDALLVQVAARLSGALGETDTVARLGGDEFAVIQQTVAQPQSAAALADHLIAMLAQPYDLDGQQAVIGVSIGIAFRSNSVVNNSEELMKRADVALYSAKRGGRGQFRFFEPEMDEGLRKRRAIEQDLQGACARNELALSYQPLCDAATLTVVGHEALLRWNHPVRGKVQPAEFIPVLEETGLILQVGRWVIETACREAASWAKPLRIAVNVSPVQFKDASLVAFVEEVIKRHGLRPDRLELEITEGVLIDDTERVIGTLQGLKALGIRIVLDDFGTGYSSLSYLRRFPFDKIKIDRSFIQSLGTDREADTLVGSIIALGRSLQLEVNAEGVETAAQRDQLRGLQCNQLQGYLLGRPVTQIGQSNDAEVVSNAA